MSEAREAAIQAVLAEAGMAGAVRLPLSGDASTRSYHRLQRQGRFALLMDAPPKAESAPCPPEASPEERAALGYNALARLAACRVDAFVAIADRLRELGLSAPAIYACDVAAGLAVIEDFGDDQYLAAIDAGADAGAYYAAAIDVLVRLHEVQPSALLESPRAQWPLLAYDRVALHAEAALLPEWYGARQLGVAIGDAALGEWRAAWDEAFAALDGARRVLSLRDFHSPNLMWLGGREGAARAGLLDFQDALAGHPAYDLASLLEDARRDVAPEFAETMLQRYLAEAAVIDEEGFRAAFAVLAAQRNAKIIGIFARLKFRDNRPSYVVRHQPRVLGYFRRDLAHPALAPVAGWTRRHLPGLVAPASEGAAA
jgi:hypothetical protein